MSGKNRAFALAVATAALVGMSAPVASAATFQPNPNGFNNDSILNLSGNQVPVQACTSGASANTVTSTQAVASGLGSILPIISSGAVSPMQGNTCTQSPTQTNGTTSDVTSTSAPIAGPDSNGPVNGPNSNGPVNSPNSNGPTSWSHHSNHNFDPSSDPTTNGFNNDSLLNLSGNQLPIQACTSGAGVNTATITQAVISGLVSFAPFLTTGDVSPLQGNQCSQTPTQTSTTSSTVSSS